MKSFFIFISLFVSNSAFATALYWYGGTAPYNWSDYHNWSTTSTSVFANAGHVIPTSADDLTFDGSSATDCVLNTATAKLAKTIDLTNYIHTITFNVTLTVSGNISLCTACTIAGTGTLAIAAAGTITTNGTNWPNTFQDAAPGATIHFSSDWTVGGFIVSGNSTFAGGFTLYDTGSLSVTGTPVSAIVRLTGSGTWTGNAVSYIPTLTINPTGTYTVSGNVSVCYGGSFTYIASTGSVSVAAGSTLNVIGNGSVDTIDSAGITWVNVTVGANTITLHNNSAMTMTGDFTVLGSTTNVTLSGSPINIGGNFYMDNLTTAHVSGLANVVMTGNGKLSMSSILAAGYLGTNLEINAPGATVTLSGTINYSTTTFTYTAGTVTTASNWVLSGSGVNITANATGLGFNSITTSANTTFGGSQGFSIGTLTDTTAGTTLTLTAGNTYKVTSSLVLSGSKTSHVTVASSAGSDAFLVLSNLAAPEATSTVGNTDATYINSSGGGTVWDFGSAYNAGTNVNGNNLSHATNWKTFTQPPTVSFTR